MIEPASIQLASHDGGEYFITAASWKAFAECRTSYEIGIRHKKTGEFKLFQGDFDFQSVQEVANAIAHLLKIEDYTPEWCIEHFK